MQVTGEITQAVSVDAFKRSRHVMPDDTEDDVLFGALLSAAQAVVETGTNRLMTPRTAVFSCRALGYRRWFLPVVPVSVVSAIEWNDAGTWVDLDVSGIWLESRNDAPQLVLPDGFFAGVTDGAELRVTAEIGAATVDEKLAQAVILVAADWYEAGINPDKDKHTMVSFGCRALMRQNRYQRECEWKVE